MGRRRARRHESADRGGANFFAASSDVLAQAPGARQALGSRRHMLATPLEAQQRAPDEQSRTDRVYQRRAHSLKANKTNQVSLGALGLH